MNHDCRINSSAYWNVSITDESCMIVLTIIITGKNKLDGYRTANDQNCIFEYD